MCFFPSDLPAQVFSLHAQLYLTKLTCTISVVLLYASSLSFDKCLPTATLTLQGLGPATTLAPTARSRRVGRPCQQTYVSQPPKMTRLPPVTAIAPTAPHRHVGRPRQQTYVSRPPEMRRLPTVPPPEMTLRLPAAPPTRTPTGSTHTPTTLQGLGPAPTLAPTARSRRVGRPRQQTYMSRPPEMMHLPTAPPPEMTPHLPTVPPTHTPTGSTHTPRSTVTITRQPIRPLRQHLTVTITATAAVTHQPIRKENL